MSMDDDAALRAELEAIARKDRLTYLAGLPAERQMLFRRILPMEDIRKLNQRVDLLERERRKPTLESWLADARAGRAATPEAMVEVLKELADRLRPQDADWIRRIDETASANPMQ